MRGFLQAHPNGSAAFLHRVSASKFDLADDNPRLSSHVALPSCHYFEQRGWHPYVVPAANFVPQPLRSSGASTKGGLAATLAATSSAAESCPFDTHTLYDAARRCARYDYNTADGEQLVPLFEVRQAAFCLRLCGSRRAHCKPAGQEGRGPAGQRNSNRARRAASILES